MIRRLLVATSVAWLACSSSPTPIAADASADSKSDAPACSCKDGYNVDKAPTGGTLGMAWLAWRYTATCAFAADTLDIATDAAYFGVFADSGGLPGADLVGEVASNAAADRPGFRRATLPATQLKPGAPVWIAIKANPGGIDSTLAPFAPDGTKANYTAGGPGAWGPTDSSAAIIFEVRGKCN